MKKILITLLLLLPLAAALPLLTGWQIAAHYPELHAHLTAPQHGLQLTPGDDYQRGWLQARASSQLQLADTLPALTLHHQIQHGPRMHRGQLLLARIETRISDLDAAPDPNAPPDLVTSINYRRQVISQLDIPARTMHDHAGQRLTLQRLHARFFRASDGSTETRITIGELLLETTDQATDQATLQLRNADIRWRLHPDPSGLTSGDGWLDLDFLQWQQLTRLREEQRFQLDFLNLSYDATRNSDQLAITTRYSFDRVEIDDQPLGPMELHLNLTNLHVPTLTALQQSLLRGDRQQQQQLLQQLLAAAPQLAVEQLYLFAPEGDLEATLLLTYPTPPSESDPLTLFTALHGDAQLRITEPLLRSYTRLRLQRQLHQQFGIELHAPEHLRLLQQLVDQQIDQFEKQGYLRRQHGESFITRLQLRNGQVTLNGKVFFLGF